MFCVLHEEPVKVSGPSSKAVPHRLVVEPGCFYEGMHDWCSPSLPAMALLENQPIMVNKSSSQLHHLDIRGHRRSCFVWIKLQLDSPL